MKTIPCVVLTCVALLSLPVFAQNNQELYNKELDQIGAQFEAKKIDRTTGLKEILAATKTYFPNDKLTQSFYQSLIEYSEQFDRKAITKKKFDELFEARTDRYKSAMENKERSERQAELENDRLRQAQADAYNEGMRQQRNAMAGAAAIQGIGRAFNNSFGQSITPPPQICNYYGGTRYCY
jgi:hypothetical protein